MPSPSGSPRRQVQCYHTAVTAPQRYRGLDGFRGIAVALVMLFHGQRLFAGSVVVPAFDAGWVGVDLFFALSGFLITGILVRTREHPRYWRNFVLRRALRIVPPYALLLLLVLAPRALAGVDTGIPWWTYPTFLSNYWIGAQGSHDITLDLTWSLSVEEQFYLVWPLAVWALGRRGLLPLSTLAMLLAPALRYAWFDPATEVTYMWTPCRVDSLAAGALGSLALSGPSALRSASPAVAAVLLLPSLGLLAAFGDLRTTLA